MGTATRPGQREKLLSWKEIASFLDKDVRTVRRWEQERGLPVHRIPGGKGASVFAYNDELEDWLRRDSQQETSPPASSVASLPDSIPQTGQSQEVPLPIESGGWPKARQVRLTLAFGIAALALGAVILATRGKRGKTQLHNPVRLAVLPFANLSGDTEQEYLSDGLTEEMISQLGSLNPSRLEVIARTSAMTYRHSNKSVDQIGRELAVDYVVEGSVRHSGNRLRITAQLIHAPDQTYLWAESYDRDLGDILKVEEDVSRSIANEIQVQLKPSGLPLDSRPVDAEAHEDYLRARQLVSTRNQFSIFKSIEYYNQALARDPNYASAYAGLAESYTLLGLYSVPHADLMPKAKMAAAKALELDDNLADAHVSLAGIKALDDWNWAGAEREFKLALQLNPDSARAHHQYAALYCTPLGRTQETIEHMERALKLDPVSPIINTDLGWAYFLAGDTDRAMAQYIKAVELDERHVVALDRLAQAYEQKGDFRKVLAMNEQNGEFPSEIAAVMRRGYQQAGYRGALQAELEIMTKRVKSGAVYDPYSFAFVLAKLGENDRAMEQLEIAYKEHNPGLVYMKVDPAYQALHANPKFQDLQRRVGLIP